MRLLVFAVLLGGWLPLLHAAEIYRWTDANGQVHFGQRPQAGATQVEVKPQVVERDAATREREEKTARYYEARRQEQASTAERESALQAKRDEECGTLREQLSEVSKGGRYYRVNEAGEQEYYSEEQIAAARRQLEQRIAQRCT